MRYAVWLCGVLWLITVAPLCAGEGDWFLVDARNGPATSNPQHAAFKKIVQSSGAGTPIIALAFTPHDDWVLLGSGGASWASDIDLPVCRKMRELSRDGPTRDFHSVSFSPTGGWVLLYDKHHFAVADVSESALRKLRELDQAGTPLRSVVFPPTGGWIIVSGAGEAFHHGIADAAARELDKLRKEAVRVTGVTFTSSGDWFILTDGDGVRTNRADHPAARKLAEVGGGRWLAFSTGDSPSGYTIAAAPARHVHAVLTTTLKMPGAEVAEWYVYAPHAPTFAGQRDVKTALRPDGHVVHEESVLKRPMFLSRVKGKRDELRLALSIDATLVARRLLPRVPDSPSAAVADLGAADTRLYTRSSTSLDLKAPAFREWLDRNELRRGKSEMDVAFARRAYAFIKQSFAYDGRTDCDRRPASVCRAGKADCGGLSALFVATLRANDVPARLLQGRWARSAKPGDQLAGVDYRQWHVKAEFFAHTVGWVPVDITTAILQPERGAYACFGNDAGDFITMHLDHDLIVPSFIAGQQTLFGLQNLVHWCRGKGTGKGLQAEETWVVEAK